MDAYHRRESIKTSKLSIQPTPPSPSPSPLALSNHKTSIFSPSPRPPRIVSQKKQYERMKLLFRNSTNQYYNTEIKNILQDEVRKIKQSEKVKAMIEVLKTSDTKETMRGKHHQKVAMVSEQVKQKDLQKSILNLENYLKKSEETDTRVRKFVKQRNQVYLNRSMMSQRSGKMESERDGEGSESVRYHDVSMTERKRSVIQFRTTGFTQQRKQKLRLFRQQQQGMKITSFLTRMKGVQQTLVKKQITKHERITQMKKIPAKCLSLKRNETNESTRLGWEKHYDIKNKKTESYIENKSKEKDFYYFDKSVRSLEHSRVVGDKREEINRNFMELKATKSQGGFMSSLIQKRYQQENMLQMKREFKLKKEYEKENNSRLMRKLVDKITNLKLVDSKARLPEEEIQNFDRLLKDLENGNAASADVFRETKFSAANKIVAEEELKNKTKKLKKSHRD